MPLQLWVFVCLSVCLCLFVFLYFWLAPILAIAHWRDNSLDNLYLVCLCGLSKVIRSSAAVHFLCYCRQSCTCYSLSITSSFGLLYIKYSRTLPYALAALQFSLEFAVIFLYSVLLWRMFQGTKGLNFSGLSKCMRYLYYVASLIHSGS